MKGRHRMDDTHRSDTLTAAEGIQRALGIISHSSRECLAASLTAGEECRQDFLFMDSLPTGSSQREEMNGQSPPN